MSTGRNTKAPTSDLLAGKTTTEPANRTPEGFGAPILPGEPPLGFWNGPRVGTAKTAKSPLEALEEDFLGLLRIARRFRAAGRSADARTALELAGRIIPALLEYDVVARPGQVCA